MPWSNPRGHALRAVIDTELLADFGEAPSEGDEEPEDLTKRRRLVADTLGREGERRLGAGHQRGHLVSPGVGHAAGRQD